jgi:tetratricopeptide (TPR) repeat protein
MRFPVDQDVLYRLLALLEQQGRFEEACLMYERAKRTLEALGKQPAQHVQIRYEHLRASLTSPHAEVSLLKRAPERERSPHPPVSPAAFPQRSLAEPEGSDQDVLRSAWNVPSPQAAEGTSDAPWEVLRLLEPEQAGRADLPLFSRRQFLELGIAALISRLARLDGKRFTTLDQEELGWMLSRGIIDGWKQFLVLPNAELLAVGQLQLSFVHRAHTLLHPTTRSYLYTGAYGLVGLALHQQERYQEALHAYHNAHLAALATGDPWYVAQSLICQADTYLALVSLIP